MNGDDLSFSCEECQRSFASAISLRNHINRSLVHASPERPMGRPARMSRLRMAALLDIATVGLIEWESEYGTETPEGQDAAVAIALLADRYQISDLSYNDLKGK